MQVQLPLNIGLRDGSSFDNFYAPRSGELVAHLAAAAKGEAPGQTLYLWGEESNGKTHLLEAACHLAAESGLPAAYVPLLLRETLQPGLLEDLEAVRLVCVDDVQAIAAQRGWQTALFTLSDRLRETGGSLIVSGAVAPGGLGLSMPELVSRLARGLVYQLRPLDDGERLAAMRLRARNRGLDLSREVATYVLDRYPRDTGALFALLERLDRASLVQKRRITIPFIRSLDVLGSGGKMKG